MTCDSAAKSSQAEDALKTALTEIVNSGSPDAVLPSETVDSGSKLILEHVQQSPIISKDGLDSIVKFVTVASANDQASKVESFPLAIIQMYNYAGKMELSSELVQKLSSFSVAIFNVLQSVGGAYDVLEAILKFHSFDESQESQQLLEMAAVQASRVYMKMYFTMEKAPAECSRAELCQLAALIAPLSLLVISRSGESQTLDKCLLWSIKALGVVVDPLARQRCLGYVGSCLLVKGTEHVQSVFASAEINLALMFSLSAVEIRMTLEKHHEDTDVKTVLSNDSLSCLLSALEQALDDICSGKVELASSDEFMIVFDSYKTLSMSLLFFLTLDQGASGDGMSPSQDWVLTCNAWKLLSAYLCEANDLPDKSFEFKQLVKCVHAHIGKCGEDMEACLIQSVLPLFFLISSREECVELIIELGLEKNFVNFLKSNATSNADPKVKSIVLCCQVLVHLSANHILAPLDQWDVDVLNIEDDDIFLHVTRLMLKSSCNSAILNKSDEKLTELVARLNKIALDVDGYYDECMETLELLRV